LWDVDRGTNLAVLPTHQSDTVAVAFTRTAGHEALLTGEMAGTARIWDIDDIGQRDELITFHGHQGSVTMFGFDLSRSLVISASIDKTIRLWSLETRKNVGLFQGHQSNVAALRLSPDGRHVASASRDSTVRIWEIETGHVQILPHAANGETLYIRAIAYSPDGRLLVSGSEDGKIRIWDAASGKLVHAFLAHGERIMALAFSPNGRLLASSGDDTATIKLWRADDWTPTPGLVGHDSRVYQMTFSPDSRLLLSVSDDKTARLWDVESKKELLNPIKHDSPVWSADFSADGKMIATGCQDWTVHLWNLDSDGGTRNLSNHFVVRIADGPVWHVAFNRDPENPSLGIAGQDKTVRILDLRRLSILFAQPAQLETEADERSGLQVHSVDNEFSLVPMRRE
jgi:WD40 repeat protein